MTTAAEFRNSTAASRDSLDGCHKQIAYLERCIATEKEAARRHERVIERAVYLHGEAVRIVFNGPIYVDAWAIGDVLGTEIQTTFSGWYWIRPDGNIPVTDATEIVVAK